MGNRNIISEVLAVRARSEFYSRYDYVNRLMDIERAFQDLNDQNGYMNSELLKYIPIATVACFQAFFKLQFPVYFVGIQLPDIAAHAASPGRRAAAAVRNGFFVRKHPDAPGPCLENNVVRNQFVVLGDFGFE